MFCDDGSILMSARIGDIIIGLDVFRVLFTAGIL